jgi:hypothetical protein
MNLEVWRFRQGVKLSNSRIWLEDAQTIDVKIVVFRCPQVAWQYQTSNCFPAVNQGLMLGKEAEHTFLSISSLPGSYWVVSISQRREELRGYTTWFRI